MLLLQSSDEFVQSRNIKMYVIQLICDALNIYTHHSYSSNIFRFPSQFDEKWSINIKHSSLHMQYVYDHPGTIDMHKPPTSTKSPQYKPAYMNHFTVFIIFGLTFDISQDWHPQNNIAISDLANSSIDGTKFWLLLAALLCSIPSLLCISSISRSTISTNTSTHHIVSVNPLRSNSWNTNQIGIAMLDGFPFGSVRQHRSRAGTSYIPKTHPLLLHSPSHDC